MNFEIPGLFSRTYILFSYFICHQPELLICISYWPVEAGIAKKHYKQQFPWWNQISYIPGGTSDKSLWRQVSFGFKIPTIHLPVRPGRFITQKKTKCNIPYRWTTLSTSNIRYLQSWSRNHVYWSLEKHPYFKQPISKVWGFKDKMEYLTIPFQGSLVGC